jgi:hypothetical protein
VKEHFLVARAAAGIELSATARAALTAGIAVLGTLTRTPDDLCRLADAVTKELGAGTCVRPVALPEERQQ